MEILPHQIKYQHLADILKEQLRTHPAGKRLPSVRSLMKRFQVSQHTVMRALDLLQREELVTRRHGSGIFRSDVNRSPTIAFCRSNFNSIETQGKENSLLAGCTKRGWKLSIHRFEPGKVDSFSDEIEADGFIILPEMVTFQSPLLSRIVKNQIPRIVLGRDTGSAGLDFVTGNDYGVLNELILGLVERGHNKLAFLVSEVHFYEVRERIKAFSQLCRILGLEYVILAPQIQYGENSISKSETFLRKYLTQHSPRLPFTALITCSLCGSIPALRVLYYAGFKVPDNCSLCCMGTDTNSHYLIPSLTNASAHHQESAEACLSLLEKRFAGDASPLLFEMISYHVQWRESTPFLNAGTKENLP